MSHWQGELCWSWSSVSWLVPHVQPAPVIKCKYMYTVNREMFVNFFGLGMVLLVQYPLLICRQVNIWRVKFLPISHLETKWTVFKRTTFEHEVITMFEYPELCIYCFTLDKPLWVSLSAWTTQRSRRCPYPPHTLCPHCYPLWYKKTVRGEGR